MYRTTYEGRWGDIRDEPTGGIRELAEADPPESWEWVDELAPCLRSATDGSEWRLREVAASFRGSNTEQELHLEVAEALIKAQQRRANIVGCRLDQRAGITVSDYVRAVYDCGVLVEIERI